MNRRSDDGYCMGCRHNTRQTHVAGSPFRFATRCDKLSELKIAAIPSSSFQKTKTDPGFGVRVDRRML
jgi:hypothetical protein